MRKIAMRVITVLVLLSMVLPFCLIPATAATVGTATLVTDASDLKAGDQIIIVASGYDYALSATQNGNNRGQADITKSDSVVTFDENTQVITLEEGMTSGTFAFKTELGYLYAASSASNHLKTETALTANSSWSVSIADGVATVLAQGEYTRNRIFYNSSNKIFSCYAPDSTTQKTIAIYLVTGLEEQPDAEEEQPDTGSDLEDGDTNVLIKNAANLKVGDKIIIAALDYDYAISTTQNSNNRARADIVKTDDTVSYGSDVQIIELVEGTVSGSFGFMVDGGYLYAASSSKNYLKTTTTLSDNASWVITMDADTGSATIEAQGTFSINLIRYNASGSGLFSCYGANNTQKDVCVYLIRNENAEDLGTGTEDTSGTGYDSADDVTYSTVDGVITNWGARNELAQFLSDYADSYYVGDYTYETMSQLSGGTSASDAPGSDLYAALQAMMVAEHTSFTKYSSSSSMDCRKFYQYTDCQKNDYAYVSTFYLSYKVAGAWDNGSQYNQEHVWPKSKCIGTEDTDIGDIMQLRAANPNENSARGNTAYGESSDYYTPNANVRGDCARILLYMYVRWGNTDYMWGTSGVMESLDILLKWMEEDPVDTWEMGRNDSVESITGVRNVFVDYPQYAWLLFGEEIPVNMSTPSGYTEDSREAYVISDTKLVLGNNALTLDATAVTTIYEFSPTQAGVYRFTADNGNALVGYWGGGTFYVFDQTENKTNVLENILQNTGPSIMVGVSGVSSVNLLVERTGDAPALPETFVTNYVNTHSFIPFEVDSSATTVKIDPTDDVVDTVVLGKDGFYHLNHSYGPLVLINLKKAPINIGEAAELHQLNVIVTGEDGNYYKTDYSDAMAEYLGKGLYPVTKELAMMLMEVGNYKDWWVSGGFFVDEGKTIQNPDTAWLILSCYVDGLNAAVYFPDVSADAWYATAVEYAVMKGYFTGYKSGNFGPDDRITRQDFVVVLSRIAGVDLKEYSGRTNFPDVKAGDYYEAAVKWASSEGIVNGYKNGNFGVGDQITREQMMTILYNFAKKNGYDVSVPDSAVEKLNNYTDAHKITGYAKPAVIWALHKGVISGMTATTIAPQNSASRAQAATILMNISKKGIMEI